ncbi:putative disease resistance protein RGA1 [Phalaenopsis equestris]|uniref:putative disease resistance protein RGA1 n=1 Tax=Phalaenopsis equestris TaxID=78828 RepID=UPI0009E36CBB|nr:putative disease resistance protein RGA1 [Phalaenopsis equestris]
MYDASLISNLEYIKLAKSLEWETLPPFGQLPFLKYQYLHAMPKAKRLDHQFHLNDDDCVFPSLKVLHIENLKSIGGLELPSLPPKLKKMEIENMGWESFNWLQDTNNCCSITIHNCGNLKYLRGETLRTTLLMEPLRNITSLQRLPIFHNKEQSLPSSLEGLSSLELLHVRDVLQLLLLPNIPSFVEQLDLVEFESLQILPSSLSTISSLKDPYKRNIPLVKSLPDLLRTFSASLPSW